MIYIRPWYTSDVVYHSAVEHADVVTRPPIREGQTNLCVGIRQMQDIYMLYHTHAYVSHIIQEK